VFENSGNYFGRFSNLPHSNSNLNLNFGQVTLALAIPLFLSFSLLQTDQGEVRGFAWRSSLCNHRIWGKSFSPCPIQLASRERSSPRPTLPEPLSLPPASINPAAIDTQSLIATLLAPKPRPCDAETHPAHPTPPLDIVVATESTRSGQSATDRSPTHHFATGPVRTPMINSPKQKTTIPAVHATLTPPDRRRHATQRAQSACAVPVHQHIP
jgi:hypothetical protein